MRSAPFLLLLALATSASACNPRPPKRDAWQSAGPGVRALVGGLARGDVLAGVTVEDVGVVEEGRIPIVVSNGPLRARLEIALPGDGPVPLATTERYALFWGATGSGATIDAETMAKAVEALAERVRKHEATVPRPPGMTPYGNHGNGEKILCAPTFSLPQPPRSPRWRPP